MPDHADLIDFYRSYGAATFTEEEPAYAEVCARIGEHPELVELIAAHDPEAHQPNLLFAAVHYLLLGGLDHPLREIYAGASSQPVMPVFANAVLSNRETVDHLLRRNRTQTNEVGRSAVLALMLNDASRRSERPLAWLDLGASGGLNLHLDTFRINYEFDGSRIAMGPSGAAVQLDCEMRGGGPEINAEHAHIAWRLGVDRSPIDVTDPDQARWLQACLWPSQPERHARLASAIAVAQQNPHTVVQADAVEGVALALEQAPVDAAFVMTTTWVWYYLPEQTQSDVVQLLSQSQRRVLWYSLEGRGVVHELGQPAELKIIDSLVGRVVIDGGAVQSGDVLGLSHPHGAWLDWHPT